MPASVNQLYMCSDVRAERLSARRSLEVQEAMQVVREKETQLSRLQSSLVRMEVDARSRSRSPSPDRSLAHVSQVRGDSSTPLASTPACLCCFNMIWSAYCMYRR